MNYVPPESVAYTAKRGLLLRRKHRRGGTRVGIRRGFRLLRREPMTYQDIKKMSAWFARHSAARKSAKKVWGQDTDPSTGWIAWLLWGGNEGRAWVDGILGHREPYQELSTDIPNELKENTELVRSLREAGLI